MAQNHPAGDLREWIQNGAEKSLASEEHLFPPRSVLLRLIATSPLWQVARAERRVEAEAASRLGENCSRKEMPSDFHPRASFYQS
jgi:hypothetical protein